MALIHLNYLAKLEEEADLLKAFAMSTCYNTFKPDDRIEPIDFVTAIKTHEQAQNLYKKLETLYKHCTDFAVGNFQPYQDEHARWAEEGQAYDPFMDLLDLFENGMIDDLPESIEQYTELLRFAAQFSWYQATKEEGLDQFFSPLPGYYSATDEQGEPVLIPDAAVPQDLKRQWIITRQIQDIEVEYCLDNYNAFYQQVKHLIHLNRPGNIQVCALAILSLYGNNGTT